MTRDTSIEAYHAIKESGLLSAKRWQVYDILFEHGPLTATGISKYILDFDTAIGSAHRNVHARLDELKKMTVVAEVGKTTCPLTNMTVYKFDVTENMPVPLDRTTLTQPEMITALCNLLDEVLPRIKPETEAGRSWVSRTQSLLAKCEKYRKR